jgi:hypothetical protein
MFQSGSQAGTKPRAAVVISSITTPRRRSVSGRRQAPLRYRAGYDPRAAWTFGRSRQVPSMSAGYFDTRRRSNGRRPPPKAGQLLAQEPPGAERVLELGARADGRRDRRGRSSGELGASSGASSGASTVSPPLGRQKWPHSEDAGGLPFYARWRDAADPQERGIQRAGILVLVRQARRARLVASPPTPPDRY